MTVNVVQHVIPRWHIHSARSRWRIPGRGQWRTRTERAALGEPRFQRGSVDHATVTITLGLISLLLVGLLGFFYLQQVVNTASQGTDIHALESQIIELKERQKQLELEGAQLRSLQAVQERIKKLNLVQTERVTYLAPVQDRVAAAIE